MNRLLVTTAVVMLIGASPALAQSPEPGNDTQAPAMNVPTQPSSPSATPSSEPGMKTPDATNMKAPEAMPDAMKTPQQSTETMTTAPKTAQFLSKQQPEDWLASQIIGQSTVNAQNETIGDVNDLVTDRNGKIVAALIGVGGFLGIGEKDVAVSFDDLTLTRDENNDVKVTLDLSKEALTSAPDYKLLNEQSVVEGSAKTDREDEKRTY